VNAGWTYTGKEEDYVIKLERTDPENEKGDNKLIPSNRLKFIS
jgi:hypothetical protein